jgi:hypothetical protein
VYLYRAPVAGRAIRDGGDECLRALVPALLDLDVTRLVIESCNQDHRDQQIVQPISNRLAVPGRFVFLHSVPSAEPMLWAADATAWAYGRSGDWRRRVEAMICGVTELS